MLAVAGSEGSDNSFEGHDSPHVGGGGGENRWESAADWRVGSRGVSGSKAVLKQGMRGLMGLASNYGFLELPARKGKLEESLGQPAAAQALGAWSRKS